MSLQTFGLMKLYWADVPWTSACPRGVRRVVRGAQRVRLADGGLPAMSWKKTNGSCLAAYKPEE